MECRIAHLRPAQLAARLKEFPAVYVPFGPLEWHGPHLPYGMDPLNAENVARLACEATGGLLWPTQYWGTERERRPEQLASLGFPADRFIVGMDFPKHLLPSMYCPEEVLAVLVREILREIAALGGKAAVLVNGHGAENHMAVFQRLEREFNNTNPLRVLFRMALPKDKSFGSCGHAEEMETSILLHLHPDNVDLKTLPPHPEPLRYGDYGIVDGPGFDGGGGPGATLLASADPRTKASAPRGKQIVEATARELAGEVRKILGG